MTHVLQIYTDGSFAGASRTGGWAFVVNEGDRRLHVASGRIAGTSNNTFEVLAVLQAMFWVAAEAPDTSITIFTDSVNVIESCRRWRNIWRTSGWKRIKANPHARRRPIPDVEIWRQLDALLEQHSQVKVEWCKGHAGTAGNELADAMARNAAGCSPDVNSSASAPRESSPTCQQPGYTASVARPDSPA